MMLHAPAPMYPTRGRLAALRDLAVIGVCLAILLGFLVQVWGAPPSPSRRAAASALQDHA